MKKLLVILPLLAALPLSAQSFEFGVPASSEVAQADVLRHHRPGVGKPGPRPHWGAPKPGPRPGMGKPGHRPGFGMPRPGHRPDMGRPGFRPGMGKPGHRPGMGKPGPRPGMGKPGPRPHWGAPKPGHRPMPR